MNAHLQRAGERLRRAVAILPDLCLWPRLCFARRRRGGKPRVLIAVHEYFPRISGAGVHVQWIAEELQARGYDCWVYAARASGEPRRVNGIRIITEPRLARYFDVVFTYSEVLPQACLAKHMQRWAARPRWLHYPCAFPGSGEMVKHCDRVIAMNPKDVALTVSACGDDRKVRRIRVGVHPSRTGQPGRFRAKYGIRGDYLLWVGAWLPAKGVRHLCDRFLGFRRRHPDHELKLVMFGGYGDRERPPAHEDIIVIDRNSEDVPDALRDCLCVVFNSPPAPVGFDANPLILIEGMMNAKTFVAQAGTPLLTDIANLGFVVATDEEWMQAVRTIVYDGARRQALESACTRAYRETYNLPAMMEDLEAAIQEVLSSLNPEP